MIKNHLKNAFRNLWKNRMFSILNLAGLTLGLASIMTLLFGVYAYSIADNDLKNKDQLFYLNTVETDGESYMQTTYPLLGEIVQSSPEISAATHIQLWSYPWLEYNGKEVQENTKYVDTSFFKVFTLPLKYGRPETALTEKYSVVITSAISQRFFGDINPVGKTIKANDSLNLTVTGVLEPTNAYSSIDASVLMTSAFLYDLPGFRESADWYNEFTENFIRLEANANIPKLETRIKEIASRDYGDASKIKNFKLSPFPDYRMENNKTVSTIITGSIATSIFIMLIVLVNLLNLNTSLMYGRTKEVAIRKIMGGNKISLIAQFCIENGLLVIASLILAGLIFSGFLQPQMNTIYGSKFGKVSFDFAEDYPIVLLYLALGIMITLIVGIFPALRYVSLPVATAIKGKIGSFKSNFLVRNAFITLQFALAIIFICTAIVLNSQIKYMQQAPLGFNAKNVDYVKLDLEYKNKKAADSYFETILDKLKANPYVENLSTSQMIPTQYRYNYNGFYDPETHTEVSLRKADADEGYLKTYEIPLVTGRDFDDALVSTESKSIIINRKAMKALGWKDLNNKQLIEKGGEEETYNVIGVMEDFHYANMQHKIEPLLHYYAGKQGLGNNNYLSLRIAKGHKKQVMNSLKNDFKNMDTRRDFQYGAMASEINGQYALIDGILKTVNFVAFLTILIACLGMFGLISLIAKKRVKEIGIRKTLGAGVTKIIVLLSKDFIKLVFLACVIAFPIAWLLMNNWLQDFAYRIDLSWWMFALGGFIALFITALTVGVQSVNAAMANPVDSLRTE